ncbi:MAG: T9SS type A sorting domain-containing protein [Weeksellaceae bacterium]|nr:T9SS type A sorting domain-containing protein [Weeksellaceae bacterium]
MMRILFFLMFLSFSTFGVYAQQTGAGINTVSNVHIKKVSISPNPASTIVKVAIEGEHAELRSISIYSIINNEVFSKQYNNTTETVELDVRNLKKGKYLVRVMFSDNTYEVVTLIKQ